MVRRGDRVRIGGGEYIVAALDGEYSLICISNGLHWSSPVTSNGPVRLGDFSPSNFEDETVEVL